MYSNHLRLPKFTLCTSQGRPSRVTEWIWSTGATYVCIGRVQCCTTKTPQVALCVKAPTRMANWQLPNHFCRLLSPINSIFDFHLSPDRPEARCLPEPGLGSQRMPTPTYSHRPNAKWLWKLSHLRLWNSYVLAQVPDFP